MNRAATPHSRELDQPPTTWESAIAVAVIIIFLYILYIVLKKVLRRVGEIFRALMSSLGTSYREAAREAAELMQKKDEHIPGFIQERTISNDEHKGTEIAALMQKKDDDPMKSLLSTTERWITHYSSSQKILLVGEGDFSFSACLARAFGSAANMVATSLDSAGTLWRRLPSSETNIDDLVELGCLVLHEVDVHDMASSYAELENMKFDRIIFNFPHAGHFPKVSEEDVDQIIRHKTLLLGFFKNSSKMLRENGEVHVGLRDDHPYNTWGAEKLAKRAGLRLIKKVEFRQADYPGYIDRRGSNITCDDPFGFGECPRTYKFSLLSNIKRNELKR